MKILMKTNNKPFFSFLMILVFFFLSSHSVMGQNKEKPRLFHYSDGEVEDKQDNKANKEGGSLKEEHKDHSINVPSSLPGDAKNTGSSKKKTPSLDTSVQKDSDKPDNIKPKKKKKVKSKEEIEEEISKNEQFTLKKYKEILDSEKFEVKNLKQRIKANEKLISQYRKKLHLTEKELERVRVELTTKAILLKRSKDEGRISTEEFNREFKRIHDRLNMESRELQADISFYKRELDRAENTLRRLKEELKVKEEAQRVARDYEKKYGGKRKFTNAEFEKIYKKFKSLLPRKLKPVFENNPFRSPFLREK